MKTKTYPKLAFSACATSSVTGTTPGIIPVSRSSWYKGIAEGRYPKPVKLGERASAWRVEDIRKLVDELNRQ